MEQELTIGDRVEAGEGVRGFAESLVGKVARTDAVTGKAIVAFELDDADPFLVALDPAHLKRVLARVPCMRRAIASSVREAAWQTNWARTTPHRKAGSDGHYWARTSDLRLVEAALSQLS